MDTLTRFELRKITRSKLFYIGIAFVVIVVLLLINMRVTGAYITDKNGKELKGLAAISLRKEYDRQLAGPLTKEKIAKVIERRQKVMQDPKNLNSNGEMTSEAYAKYEVKDEQINTLIRYAFSPLSNYDYQIIDKLKSSDAELFYQKRLEKINGYLNYDYSYGNYSAEDKSFFKQMNDRIPVPFQMDYVTGWEKALQNMQSLFLVLALAIAICLAPVFSGEYQRGTDAIILSSRYGRNKVIVAKIKASFIVSMILLILGIASYTLLLLGIFGFEGGSASVQMLDLLAPVPYTVLQTYLWTIFISSLACLFVGAVTLWLSSRMKSPFQVIIASGIFLIGPLFIPASKSSRLFNHITNLLPGNMLGSFKKVTGYEVVHILGQLIPEYKAVTGFSIIITALLLPLTYRVFRKHEVS